METLNAFKEFERIQKMSAYDLLEAYLVTRLYTFSISTIMESKLKLELEIDQQDEKRLKYHFVFNILDTEVSLWFINNGEAVNASITSNSETIEEYVANSVKAPVLVDALNVKYKEYCAGNPEMYFFSDLKFDFGFEHKSIKSKHMFDLLIKLYNFRKVGGDRFVDQMKHTYNI